VYKTCTPTSGPPGTSPSPLCLSPGAWPWPGLLHQIGDSRTSQAVAATHSPLVAAVPGATILEVGGWGCARPPGTIAPSPPH